MTSRRTFLTSTAFAGLAALAMPGSGLAAGNFPVTRPERDWKKLLTTAQYNVLRLGKTEEPFSSPLDAEKRSGVYYCVGCANPLYHAQTKFDSGTGWPSFYDALPGRTGTKIEKQLVWDVTEVHCANCGGHQGHIFDDGPAPTGKRHCINGVSLKFVPA